MKKTFLTLLGCIVVTGVGCTTTDRNDAEVVDVDRPEQVTNTQEGAVVPDRDAVGVVTGDADNSTQNKGDDETTAITAESQSNTESDVELTAKIRRALTENDDLSVYAHNVKIITKQGDVVLKGPVRTVEEKSVVEKAAIRIAGATNVKSELEVAPK